MKDRELLKELYRRRRFFHRLASLGALLTLAIGLLKSIGGDGQWLLSQHQELPMVIVLSTLLPLALLWLCWQYWRGKFECLYAAPVFAVLLIERVTDALASLLWLNDWHQYLYLGAVIVNFTLLVTWNAACIVSIKIAKQHAKMIQDLLI